MSISFAERVTTVFHTIFAIIVLYIFWMLAGEPDVLSYMGI